MTNRTLRIALLVLAAFASAAFGGGDARGNGRLYGRRIVVEISDRDKATFARELYGSVLSPKETAGELARWLEQMSGRKFEIEAASTSTDNPASAIRLLRADSAMVTADDRDRLKDKGLEAFIIRGDASRLQIIANDARGLSHGACFYLEELGVRWLLAGAKWTVVPVRSDITLAIDRLVQPAFFSRGYFGTGGFYSWVFGRRYTGWATSRKKGVSEFEKDWTNWSRRLRNGGPELGHATGEAFISDKEIQAILKMHPEYLAKINGAYTKLFIPAGHGAYGWDKNAHDYVKASPPGTGTHDLNVIAKLNAGNPDAVALYGNWILKGLRAARSGPQGHAVRTVSVEPSDGTGEGNNYDELKAQGVGDGSESDQEFHIANFCARKVRAEFPDVSVVMLAYAQRSDPPTFPLEPNFILQPAFAFRFGHKTAGLSNEEWIAAWKPKAKNMAVYDYWSIPDWSHDEPTFNYLDMAKKLRGYYSSNTSRDKKTVALAEYLFDINDSRMVHTTRIFDLGRAPAALAEFHRHDPGVPNDPPDGPGWARVHSLTHAEVAALVANGLSKYPLPDFTVKTYTGKAWSLDRLVQPYENFETLTVPQAFSLSPEVLMAPSDAL